MMSTPNPAPKTKKIYLLNSLVIPINFDKYSTARVSISKISIDEAKQMLSQPFVSAIGHDGTAKLLSQLLQINIPTNRIAVFLEKGDVVIAFFLKQRLPEGAILTKEQLEKLEFWFVKIDVIDVQ